MFALLLVVIADILFTSKFRLAGFHEDYLSVKNTQAVKGLFVILVFMSHLHSYTAFPGRLDHYTIRLLELVSQLMVTMFLFYSGYGVYESIKKKGKSYVEAFPKRRILKTFINFALAIGLFLIMNLVLGIHYPPDQILLSFIGWESIGNSSWYMFAIFVLYLLSYLVFRLFPDDHPKALWALSVLSLIYVLIMMPLRPGRYSNTFLCYSLGGWYSYGRQKVEKRVQMKESRYWCSLGALMAVAVLLIGSFVMGYQGHLKDIPSIYYNGLCLVFCLIVVAITMKVKFNSQLLSQAGRYVFWIYILQRIPMTVYSFLGLARMPYLFMILTLVSTALLAWLMDRLSSQLRIG